MPFATNRYFRIALLFLTSLSITRCLAVDLAMLKKGQHVQVGMVGFGPLCEARVQERSSLNALLKVETTTAECGAKGAVISIEKGRVADLTPEQRLTKRRIWARVLLAAGGTAALVAVPLNSSDPEAWLIFNPVFPTLIGFGAWRAIPKRLDYVLMLICPDSRHCFAAPEAHESRE